MPRRHRRPQSRFARIPAATLLLLTGVAGACQLDELLRSSEGAPDPGSSSNPTAVRLGFLVQPAGGTLGAIIAPAVRVAALDQNGVPVTSFSGTISITLSQNPGDATLQGTTTRSAFQGVAEFPDLAVNKAGNGYRLGASGNNLASATSSAFSILARVPADLEEVSGNDQTDTVGAALRSPYVIRVVDEDGAPLPGIQVAWNAGSSGGSVNPTTSVTGASGEAETVHTLGTVAGRYAVTAWIGELPGADVVFESRARAGRATQLAFTQEPSNTERNDEIRPPVEVTAYDQFGNVATDFTSTVTMSLVPGSGPPGARLEGDRTRAGNDGVATFDNLRIRDPGLGYRLRASAPGNLQKDSQVFHIWLTVGDDDDDDDDDDLLLGSLFRINLLGGRMGAPR
jgi:hypothetical protein